MKTVKYDIASDNRGRLTLNIYFQRFNHFIERYVANVVTYTTYMHMHNLHESARSQSHERFQAGVALD